MKVISGRNTVGIIKSSVKHNEVQLINKDQVSLNTVHIGLLGKHNLQTYLPDIHRDLGIISRTPKLV